MHCHRLRPRTRPQRFSYVQPTSHISVGISFKLCKWLAMAEIWPLHSFDSPGGKIILWGNKNVKNFDITCVQAVGHSFFQIYFIFSA